MPNITLSFDISTTCTGYSLFNAEGQILDAGRLKFKTPKTWPKGNEYLYKAQVFTDFITQYKGMGITRVLVEQPLARATDVNTVNTLLRFNGICCYLCYEHLDVMPEFKTVNDIRRVLCPEMINYTKSNPLGAIGFIKAKIDPKEYIFQKVMKWYPHLDWTLNRNGAFSVENRDMSDAIAVNLSFLIEEKIIDINTLNNGR